MKDLNFDNLKLKTLYGDVDGGDGDGGCDGDGMMIVMGG